jgi:hypothetical protein
MLELLKKIFFIVIVVMTTSCSKDEKINQVFINIENTVKEIEETSIGIMGLDASKVDRVEWSYIYNSKNLSGSSDSLNFLIHFPDVDNDTEVEISFTLYSNGKVISKINRSIIILDQIILSLAVDKEVSENSKFLMQIEGKDKSRVVGVDWEYKSNGFTNTGYFKHTFFELISPTVDYNIDIEVFLSIHLSNGNILERKQLVRILDSKAIINISNFDDIKYFNILEATKKIQSISIEKNKNEMFIIRDNQITYLEENIEENCGQQLQIILKISTALKQFNKSISINIYCLEQSIPSGVYQTHQELSFSMSTNIEAIYIEDGAGNTTKYDKTYTINQSAKLKYYIKNKDYVSKEVLVDINIVPELTTISENGVTLWLNQPSSVRYKGHHDRTYFTWVENSAIYMKYLDNDTLTWSQKQLIHQWNYPNDHSTASLLIPTSGVNKGKIILFFSYHASPLYTLISLKAEEIDLWQELTVIESGRATYPQPVYLENDKIILLYRYQESQNPNREESLRIAVSYDGGETWGSIRTIISFGVGYWIYSMPPQYVDGTLYMLWNIYNAHEKKYMNAYYSETNDLGLTWKSLAEPTEILDRENSIKVLDSAKMVHTRLWDFKVSPNREVRFTYISDKSTTSDVSIGWYAEYNGEKVMTEAVTTIRKSYYSDGIILHPIKPRYIFSSDLDTCMVECITGKKNVNGTWKEDMRIETNNEEINSRYQFILNDESHCMTWLGVREYTKWTKFDASLNTNCDVR